MTLLAAQVTGIRAPRQSPESAPYWEGTRAGELRFQRCVDCDHANFGPGVRCAACTGRNLAWEVSSGSGRVYSWTVVWRPQRPEFAVPYAPAIIRLDEGYDMVSALVGLEPDAIAAGLRVQATFHRVDDTITLPFFEPA